MPKPIDFNLFFVAESLYKHLNVSKAAKELRISQSAVSHALGRMRRQFNDPMFVRVAKGMAPTELAKKMRPYIEQIVGEARSVSTFLDKPDLSKTKARITIGAADSIEILLGPGLTKRLRKEAPLLQLSFRPLNGEFPKAQFEAGAIDLTITGFAEELPEGFHRMKVLEDTFSVGMRKTHPLAKKAMSAEDYFQGDHALIAFQGDFKDRLAAKGKAYRNFRYASHSFSSVAWTLASTDLILTAPTLLLKAYAEYFPIISQKSPISIQPLKLYMIWHSLTHQDPTHLRVRAIIREEFAAISKKRRS